VSAPPTTGTEGADASRVQLSQQTGDCQSCSAEPLLALPASAWAWTQPRHMNRCIPLDAAAGWIGGRWNPAGNCIPLQGPAAGARLSTWVHESELDRIEYILESIEWTTKCKHSSHVAFLCGSDRKDLLEVAPVSFQLILGESLVMEPIAHLCICDCFALKHRIYAAFILGASFSIECERQD